jgi:hypothetical protein
MSNEYKLDPNCLAAKIKRGNGRYNGVSLHKREAIFLWNVLRDRNDGHATNLKRKIMNYTVRRYLLHVRKEEMPYLLAIIQGAMRETHSAFNDYITGCGIDPLTLPKGQLVRQGDEPSCPMCPSATEPPCEICGDPVSVCEAKTLGDVPMRKKTIMKFHDKETQRTYDDATTRRDLAQDLLDKLRIIGLSVTVQEAEFLQSVLAGASLEAGMIVNRLEGWADEQKTVQ